MVRKRTLDPTPAFDHGLLTKYLAENSIKELHAIALWEQLLPDLISANPPVSFERVRDRHALPRKGVPVALKRLLVEDSTFTPLSSEVDDVQQAGSTTKLLVRLQDGKMVESVIIYNKGYNTLCVSSQVGCRMACTFCATGTMGLLEQDETDRHRIQDLLQLAQPIRQEVTYFKDRAPDTLTTNFVRRKRNPLQQSTRTSTSNSSSIVPAGLNTVVLPNEATESLHVTIEALRTQLEDQLKLSANRARVLTEDCKVRDVEYGLRHVRQQERIRTMQENLEEMSKRLRESTKHYLSLRRSTAANMREMTEALSDAEREKDVMSRGIRIALTEARQQQESLKEEATEFSEKYIDKFRRQAARQQTELHCSKDEYIASKQRYDEKTRQLVARIEMLKHRYRSLEKRRAMELSEFGREIKLLRGQLNTVERTVRFIRTAPPAQTNSAQKSAHADLRNIKNHLENMLRDLKSEV